MSRSNINANNLTRLAIFENALSSLYAIAASSMINTNRLILLVCFFCFALNGKAQNSKTAGACDSIITIVASKYSRTYVMMRKKISTEEVQKRLNMFSSSSFEVQQHKKWYKISTILLYSSALGFLAGRAIYSANHNYLNTAEGITYGAGATTVFTLIGFTLSSRHYDNAFNAYNREMCLR